MQHGCWDDGWGAHTPIIASFESRPQLPVDVQPWGTVLTRRHSHSSCGALGATVLGARGCPAASPCLVSPACLLSATSPSSCCSCTTSEKGHPWVTSITSGPRIVIFVACAGERTRLQRVAAARDDQCLPGPSCSGQHCGCTAVASPGPSMYHGQLGQAAPWDEQPEQEAGGSPGNGAEPGWEPPGETCGGNIA